MISGMDRKCSRSRMTLPNRVRSSENMLDRGVKLSRRYFGMSGRYESRRRNTPPSSAPSDTTLGAHCLSSPTTITRGASHSRNKPLMSA